MFQALQEAAEVVLQFLEACSQLADLDAPVVLASARALGR